MSLSFTKQSDSDIEVARILSPKKSEIVYLNHNKCNDNLFNIIFNEEIIDLVMNKSLNQIINELSRSNPNNCEIKLTTNEIISIIPSNCPEDIYITGNKGWGKSSLAARYALEYRMKFPDRKVYLFTRRPDDPAYNGVDIDEEIIVNEDVMKSGLVFEQLINSLVIFDDLDNLTDKDIFIWVHNLINEVITCGRKENIHLIYISHLIADYKRTRIILNEADKVIFCNGMGTYQNSEFLKRYAGLDPDKIRHILSLEGWVCLSRVFPMYIIYKRGLFML